MAKWDFHRNAKMAQYIQTDKLNRAHRHTERQKPYDPLNSHRKNIQ
jgi:hypothetical protein